MARRGPVAPRVERGQAGGDRGAPQRSGRIHEVRRGSRGRPPRAAVVQKDAEHRAWIALRDGALGAQFPVGLVGVIEEARRHGAVGPRLKLEVDNMNG